MLTLITGAPGAGKTAALVSMLEELGKERELWVNGIPDLKIPHRTLEDPSKWIETVPDGSVIIIDEVQNVWRPAGPGQKIPDHIAALETHRHRGLDFYIITQGPNLVHSNVRALVGRHVHLRDLGVLGRWWYEWPETADNCRTGWKNAPIKKRYKLPKKIFGSYKSSSLHVKPVRSFPFILVVLVAALLGVGVMGWLGYKAITGKMAPAPVAKPAATSTASGEGSGAGFVAGGGLGGGPVDERIGFTGRLSNRPWTAPAFDGLRVVAAVPYITGAICVNNECKCYHGKGRLLDVSSEACHQWAKDQPFNPYVPDEKPEADKAQADNSGARAPSGNATTGRSMLDGVSAPSTLPAT